MTISDVHLVDDANEVSPTDKNGSTTYTVRCQNCGSNIAITESRSEWGWPFLALAISIWSLMLFIMSTNCWLIFLLISLLIFSIASFILIEPMFGGVVNTFYSYKVIGNSRHRLRETELTAGQILRGWVFVALCLASAFAAIQIRTTREINRQQNEANRIKPAVDFVLEVIPQGVEKLPRAEPSIVSGLLEVDLKLFPPPYFRIDYNENAPEYNKPLSSMEFSHARSGGFFGKPWNSQLPANFVTAEFETAKTLIVLVKEYEGYSRAGHRGSGSSIFRYSAVLINIRNKTHSGQFGLGQHNDQYVGEGNKDEVLIKLITGVGVR